MEELEHEPTILQLFVRGLIIFYERVYYFNFDVYFKIVRRCSREGSTASW